MKGYALLAAAAGVASVLAIPSTAAAPSSASVVIRHQVRGCHTWSLNGGQYRRMLELRIRRGGSITITNNDPMVHKLVQLAGRAVVMQHPADHHMTRMGRKHITGRGVMNHMGARLRVTFLRGGLHRFTTEDLGDYFELKTSGMHNHLMLVVRVS